MKNKIKTLMAYKGYTYDQAEQELTEKKDCQVNVPPKYSGIKVYTIKPDYFGGTIVLQRLFNV